MRWNFTESEMRHIWFMQNKQATHVVWMPKGSVCVHFSKNLYLICCRLQDNENSHVLDERNRSKAKVVWAGFVISWLIYVVVLFRSERWVWLAIQSEYSYISELFFRHSYLCALQLSVESKESCELSDSVSYACAFVYAVSGVCITRRENDGRTNCTGRLFCS